jgi:hypothetical protein
MHDDVRDELAEYGRYHRAGQAPVTADQVREAARSVSVQPRRTQNGGGRAGLLVGVAAVMVGLFAAAALVLNSDDPSESVSTDQLESRTATDEASQVSEDDAAPAGARETRATGGTPLPDFENAVAGDNGAGRLPLGVVAEPTFDDRLDFLFEFCQPDCFRDAHFMDPTNPDLGSGPWTAGRPFIVRHGFVNDTGEALGEDFDVVVYVTALDGVPSGDGGMAIGQTAVYRSDYVIQGVSDQCGPNYKGQAATVTCEWFVHDFADGLPEGRFAIWAFWEAPCSAWIDLGHADSCSDPNEVISLFSSGVDSPFGPFPPSFTEANEAQLTPEEIMELYGSIEHGMPGMEEDFGPPIDASGAVANFSTTPPDFEGAVAGDHGVGPLPLGTVTELPGEDHLNFLFEFCQPSCYRDAHFMDPASPDLGSGPWTAGRPFHVRHGFVNGTGEPLGEGFDVVMYVTRWDGPPSDAFSLGQTLKFTSDFVLRGTSDQCGPAYKSQTGTSTCEWFVHDFPDGLPEGRFDLWTVWEAPCSAWIDLGFTDSCGDPDEVMSLFSAGVNSPFDQGPPSFTEANEAQLTPEEIMQLYGSIEHEMGFEPFPPPGPEAEIDASGAAATAGTPLPDFENAVAGDDGAARLPLGAVTSPAFDDRLDFLFEQCFDVGQCFRDAAFINPDDPSLGSAAWQGDRPFIVRHGFINEAEQPLGDEFDVVLYIYRWDDFAEMGATRRYVSDYVLRGTTDKCGPTYRNLSGPVTCEWFVHEFPDGLPTGRHALWAFWEAPCSAWVDYGFTDSCVDPNEVMSLFSSGVDSPWESSSVIWDPN